MSFFQGGRIHLVPTPLRRVSLMYSEVIERVAEETTPKRLIEANPVVVIMERQRRNYVFRKLGALL